MTMQQRELISQILRDAPFDLGGDVSVQRPMLEQMLTSHPLPDDVHQTSGDLGGVPAVFVDVGDVPSRGILLHLHGGGFALGSAAGSVGLVSDLARRAGMSAVSIDYRLAPEHPYPAAPRDVLAAYRALVEREGGAGKIVVTGESAGGNLAVELLVAAVAEGLPVPAAAVVLSPMTDLTVTGKSFTTKAPSDPTSPPTPSAPARPTTWPARTRPTRPSALSSPTSPACRRCSSRSAPTRYSWTTPPASPPGLPATTSPSPWTSPPASRMCSKPSPRCSTKAMRPLPAPPSSLPATSARPSKGRPDPKPGFDGAARLSEFAHRPGPGSDQRTGT